MGCAFLFRENAGISVGPNGHGRRGKVVPIELQNNPAPAAFAKRAASLGVG
jgi:hypothetical protein